MIEDIPHPRETSLPMRAARRPEAAFLSALERGRLHHAWLLVGPEGVGKATFAYRAARRLLGAAADPALGLLGSAPDDPVCRQIIAGAHPDLLVLQRDTEDGKARKGISVDDARTLPAFFAKSPAASPYRVAIIDAADDLNPNAANAVLKTLEEPPERGVLFLVSHAPGGLLATLRSRCRRLRFDPPPSEASLTWVAAKAGVGEEDARRSAAPWPGARRAWHGAWRPPARWTWTRPRASILRALPEDRRRGHAGPGRGLSRAGGARRGSTCSSTAWRTGSPPWPASGRAGLAGRAGRGPWTAGRRPGRCWWPWPRDVEAVNLDRADAFFTALCRLRAIA